MFWSTRSWNLFRSVRGRKNLGVWGRVGREAFIDNRIAEWSELSSRRFVDEINKLCAVLVTKKCLKYLVFSV